jgi:hypothetical protein
MKKVSIIILVSILIVAGIVFYLNFFYKAKCDSIECWDYKLSRCDKAEFVNSNPEIVWRYEVIKKDKKTCIVDAEVIRVITGLTDRTSLEGKSMRCEIPLGMIENPQRNPALCTGELKEAMQEMIIKKLHQYIVENLGEINEELLSPEI